MDTSLHRTSRRSDPDALLAIALGISLLAHLTVLGVQLLCARWGPALTVTKPLTLIYDRETAKHASEWTREDDGPAQARIKEHARSMTAAVPESLGGLTAGLERRRDVVSGSSAAGLSGIGAASGQLGAWASDGAWATATDLTDIVQAAQGNPVLLSYFGAIREQIQRTANTQPWVPSGDAAAGTVSVGFVITRSGALQSAAVVPERSTASSQLCDAALRIVQAASPFLPFPPSFTESSKAVIVPIEFSDRHS